MITIMGLFFKSLFVSILVLPACRHLTSEKMQPALPMEFDDYIVRTKIIMATPITISLKRQDEKHFAPVFEIFKRVDRRLSSYRPDSEISQLNQKRSIKASQDTLKALYMALEIAKVSKGAFDPSLGALTLKAYGFGTSHEKPPTEEERLAALKNVGFEKIKIDGDQVSLEGDIRIDLGGIGKGFAVDLVREYLRIQSVREGVIAASGDVHCLHPCLAGIQDPRFEEQKLVRFQFRTAGFSISTSGGYERKISPEVHHIIDGKTGESAQNFLSVTLISRGDNATIDGFATALAVMPLNYALEWLKNYPEIQFVLVGTNKRIYVSQGFEEIVGDLRWSDKMADFKIIKVAPTQKN